MSEETMKENKAIRILFQKLTDEKYKQRECKNVFIISVVPKGFKNSKYDEFEKQIDHIDVLSSTEMVFHFKNGRTVSRTWEQPKRVGRPWTDEQRAKFQESIKGRYTPEVRQQMSEHMKQLRKERGKAWRKEK